MKIDDVIEGIVHTIVRHYYERKPIECGDLNLLWKVYELADRFPEDVARYIPEKAGEHTVCPMLMRHYIPFCIQRHIAGLPGPSLDDV